MGGNRAYKFGLKSASCSTFRFLFKFVCNESPTYYLNSKISHSKYLAMASEKRNYIGWKIDILKKDDVTLHLTFSDLHENDNIGVLVPGKRYEVLKIKINGHQEEQLTLPCAIHKISCSKVLRDGEGGDIVIKLSKKKGEPNWPKREDWPDNQ